MGDALRELRVLALDCQAGGATPAYGDLLELGWAVCAPEGILGTVRNHWVLPRTERRVPRAVRELTGWSESCNEAALDEAQAWHRLRADGVELSPAGAPAPTVIHFARFELPFLQDLHARLGEHELFPFDAVCVHAIATRLFPELPRRNIRALAGYLGHSPDLIRRSAGHVEATAFIWKELVPLLGEAGVHTWSDLKTWLSEAPSQPRRARRQFPFAVEQRRALPDRPGVYRFLRKSGDILYVGKATSLKKRIAGHFKSSGPATERGLELLTQVHEIKYSETPSLLEAALLEADEIKRIDPLYNVQLRTGDRRAWFASSDLADVVPAADAQHPVGPLPSERAISSFPALIALARGDAPTTRLRCMALAVPSMFAPEDALFDEGWKIFSSDILERLGGGAPSPSRRVADSSRALWLERGRAEADASPDDAPPDFWDLARVRRRLERSLIQAGLLVRRARFLRLLVDADVAFRERQMTGARGLVISSAQIVEYRDFETVDALTALAGRRPQTSEQRRRAFDAAAYDRLRVILTELCRIRDEGGDIAMRLGGHVFAGERMARLMRAI
jgi:DNA polymerase-3 subunit epsilon